MCHNFLVSKVYALIKIHKTNNPLSPVVSALGYPLYCISSHFAQILTILIIDSEFCIKNSFELGKRVRNFNLSNAHHYKLISLNVSFFLPIDLALY